MLTFRQVFGFLLLMSLLTGLLYPAATTGLSQLLFPAQATGSLVTRADQVLGSELIAQGFAGAGYFQPRPSAAGATGYDAGSSSGSNLGVSSKSLNEAIAGRIAALQQDGQPVPADLVMASGSGLDPHLSPEAARYQIARVAAARGLSPAQLEQLVGDYTEGRQLGFLGAPRVNVLRLNLALDALSGAARQPSS